MEKGELKKMKTYKKEHYFLNKNGLIEHKKTKTTFNDELEFFKWVDSIELDKMNRFDLTEEIIKELDNQSYGELKEVEEWLK